MSKTSFKKQKADEMKIINELARDGNVNMNDLAKEMGCSRQKVWRIINRLNDNGTIWGTTAIADMEKTSIKKYLVLVKWAMHPMCSDILAILKRGDSDSRYNIKSSYFTHGAFDWAFVISTNNIIGMKRFCNHLFMALPDFISDVQTSEILVPVRVHTIDNPNPDKLSEYYLP